METKFVTLLINLFAFQPDGKQMQVKSLSFCSCGFLCRKLYGINVFDVPVTAENNEVVCVTMIEVK